MYYAMSRQLSVLIVTLCIAIGICMYSYIFLLMHRVHNEQRNNSLKCSTTDLEKENDYGVFSAGMRIQLALGIPKYRTSEGQLDYERMWQFAKNYSQVVWEATRPNLTTLVLQGKGYGEIKRFLTFSREDASCLVVTFGVGQQIEAEEGLKQRYPQCRFLGVDPGQHNRELFGRLGGRSRFIQAALHGQTGKHRGSFIKGSYNESNLRYETEETEHVGIEEFFRKYLDGEEIIDLLNIDIEGAEYSILGWLAEQRSPPAICQINFEFHYPLESYGGNNSTFFADLEALMKNYAMYYTDLFTGGTFIVAHFVNVVDAKCLAKFTSHLTTITTT